MHRGLLFTAGKWLVRCEYKQYCDIALRNVFTYEKGSQFDENMKKYNEDNVNYANSKPNMKYVMTFTVGGIEGKLLNLCRGNILLLSCKFLLFTGKKKDDKRSIF